MSFYDRAMWIYYYHGQFTKIFKLKKFIYRHACDATITLYVPYGGRTFYDYFGNASGCTSGHLWNTYSVSLYKFPVEEKQRGESVFTRKTTNRYYLWDLSFYNHH
ncbi:hypothetical protein AGMMS50230_20490 [Spirochaetia bacterium]|nr:hypothetical protein AGMMS50230_20490 [Spirochaetia bacterium]